MRATTTQADRAGAAEKTRPERNLQSQKRNQRQSQSQDLNRT